MKILNIKYLLTAAVLTLLMLPERAQAQQDPQYSQYMFNQLAYNPAYAGSREALSVTMLLRRQWMGIDGGPTTGSFALHSPSGNERHGFGFNFVHDRIGVTLQNYVQASYAYRISMGRGTMALGLDAGILHHKNQFSLITPRDTDPFKPQVDLSAVLPRVGTGVYYNTEKFYIGASVPNLLAGRYFSSQNAVAEELASKQSMHIFGMIGGVLNMGSKVSFRPSAVAKYVPDAPFSADLNGTFFFANTIGVGAGYRTDDGLIFMLEYTSPRRFRAGYAYDMTLSELKNVNSGSHEIMIGIDLGWEKSKFLTPRHF